MTVRSVLVHKPLPTYLDFLVTKSWCDLKGRFGTQTFVLHPNFSSPRGSDRDFVPSKKLWKVSTILFHELLTPCFHEKISLEFSHVEKVNMMRPSEPSSSTSTVDQEEEKSLTQKKVVTMCFWIFELWHESLEYDGFSKKSSIWVKNCYFSLKVTTFFSRCKSKWKKWLISHLKNQKQMVSTKVDQQSFAKRGRLGKCWRLWRKSNLRSYEKSRLFDWYLWTNHTRLWDKFWCQNRHT